MNSFLLYIIESSICIITFYLLNRTTINKGSDFAVNRLLVLSFVIGSLLIPAIKIPYFMQTPKPIDSTSLIKNINVHENGNFNPTEAFIQNNTIATPNVSETASATNTADFLFENLFLSLYLIGVLISILLLLRNILSIWIISRNAEIQKKHGFRLLIVDKEIPSFTFMKSIVISKKDYNLHNSYILPHELAHIKLRHSYDLFIMETVKIIFWFNPVIYLVINDLKQIHEFQADEYSLKSGIDSIQYQLLLIKKSVGHEKFHIAHSFNQSQIKKRIIMINNLKTKQKFGWKFATTVIIAVLLIISFSSFTKKTSDAFGDDSKIQGAWTYVLSLNIVNGATSTRIYSDVTPYREMKIWSDGFYAFVGNQGTGGYSFGGSGKYKLNGTDYEETVFYSPVQSMVGQTMKLKLEIKNDTLTQIWPVDESGNYDKQNYNIIKMVRMK